MNNTRISVVGMLTGDQFVDVVKTLVVGAVVLLLAYGAYNSGYSLQLSKDGVELALSPDKKVGVKC